MIDESVRRLARCKGCGKAYRVPAHGGPFRCRGCSGAVEVINEHASERPLIEGTLTCTQCHAIQPGHESSCVECGTALTHPADSAGAAPAEDSFARRHEANDALKRAYSWIGGVTWSYRLGALAYAVATLLAVLALARTDVPPGPGVLVVGLTTLLSVLLLMGAFHILFHPFAWTLVIAIMATAVSLVHYYGPNPLGLGFAGAAAWALLAWLALLPTWRFHRLIDEHKDLYITHHASVATRRTLKGRTPEQRHERLMAAMHRANLSAWKVSVPIAILLIAGAAFGSHTVLNRVRVEDFSSVLAGFETAWNDSGLEGAAEFFDPAVRDSQVRRLTGFIDGHGWGARPPELHDGEVRAEAGSAFVGYELGSLPMTASWVLDELHWALLSIELPVPPLEPVIERFRAAWRAADPEAIVGFYAPESRAKMLASVQDSVERRDWKTFPEIVETKMDSYTDGRADVDFRLERRKVATRWRLRADGTWGLIGLKLPPP